MIPPSEIQARNIRGQVFYADAVRNQLGEYKYNVAEAAFQYRIRIPGIILSMITIDVPENELREFVKSGKPVTIRQQ
jgi:hypothetical protein